MRFTRIHVLIIGLIVVVGLAVAFGMAYARPQLNKLNDTRNQVEQQRQIADTMIAKLQDLAAAQANFELKDQQVYAYLDRMPQISTDRYQGMIDLWQEYAGGGPVVGGGPKMRDYVMSQPGITPTGLSLPFAPTAPLDPVPVILVPINNFAVRANGFPAIIRFLRAISKAPRMATISNVSISGVTPNLQAAMPLTIYLVTRWALPGPGRPPLVAAPAAPGAPEAPPAPAEEVTGRE